MTGERTQRRFYVIDRFPRRPQDVVLAGPFADFLDAELERRCMARPDDCEVITTDGSEPSAS